MNQKEWELFVAINDALENPTPAQKIRNAGNDALDEADPFIIPLSKSKMPHKPQEPPPAPADDLTVLEAVERRLALMEGQHGAPLLLNERLEALRAMVRDGLTRYECKERIIAFYTARFHARTEERLALLEQGYHNNRLEGQEVTPERFEAIRAMIKAGRTPDEISASIVAHYSKRAKKK